MRLAPLLLASACATAPPRIAEVVSVFPSEHGFHAVVTEPAEDLVVGSRWQVVDATGSLGLARVVGRDRTGFCDDAACAFYELELTSPRPPGRHLIGLGPLTRPLPRARLLEPSQALVEVDLDGDGDADLSLTATAAGSDEDCFELRQRGAGSAWRTVYRRCRERHF